MHIANNFFWVFKIPILCIFYIKIYLFQNLFSTFVLHYSLKEKRIKFPHYSHNCRWDPGPSRHRSLQFPNSAEKAWKERNKNILQTFPFLSLSVRKKGKRKNLYIDHHLNIQSREISVTSSNGRLQSWRWLWLPLQGSSNWRFWCRQVQFTF